MAAAILGALDFQVMKLAHSGVLIYCDACALYQIWFKYLYTH